MSEGHLFPEFYGEYEVYRSETDETETHRREVHSEKLWTGELLPPRHGTNPVTGFTQYEILGNTPIKFKARNTGYHVRYSIKYVPFPTTTPRQDFFSEYHYRDPKKTNFDTISIKTEKDTTEEVVFWASFQQPGFYSIRLSAVDLDGVPGRTRMDIANSKYSNDQYWVYDFIVHSEQQFRQHPIERILTILGYISTLYFAGSIGKEAVVWMIRYCEQKFDETDTVYEQTGLDQFLEEHDGDLSAGSSEQIEEEANNRGGDEDV